MGNLFEYYNTILYCTVTRSPVPYCTVHLYRTFTVRITLYLEIILLVQ